MAKRRLAGLIGWGTAFGASLLSAALAADLPPDRAVLSHPALRPTAQVSSGVLLVSDSPETPARSGLLYRDTVPGQAIVPGQAGAGQRIRVLAYHVNGLGRPARLLLLARNVGAQPAALTVQRQGSAVTLQPDPLIGQQTLLRYFASGPRPARSLEGGEQAVLYDSGALAPGSVVSLLLDLESPADLQLSVTMTAQGERPSDDLPVLPADAHHQRGTFLGADRTLEFLLPSDVAAPLRFTLSGPDDPPLLGQDALTGRPQILLGNFGVLYTLRVSGAAGRVLAASPRGGPYRGSLLLQDGLRSSQVLMGQGQALKDPAAPAALWSIRSPEFQLQIVPASGSSLPLALLFYPGKFLGPPR